MVTPGLAFNVQIQEKLDETDILIIVYTGVDKPNHSWTGVELGYFLSALKHNTSADLPRKIVPIFLENPPRRRFPQFREYPCICSGRCWR
jgi:hypothetical protein